MDWYTSSLHDANTVSADSPRTTHAVFVIQTKKSNADVQRLVLTHDGVQVFASGDVLKTMFALIHGTNIPITPQSLTFDLDNKKVLLPNGAPLSLTDVSPSDLDTVPLLRAVYWGTLQKQTQSSQLALEINNRIKKINSLIHTLNDIVFKP
eukprot:1931577-Rhodomonas_salina.4